MTLLRRRPPFSTGYAEVFGPDNSPLRWLHFGLLHLDGEGTCFDSLAGEREYAVSVFSGSCDVCVFDEAQREAARFHLSRANPFEDPPVVAYIPRDMGYRIICASQSLAAGVISTPARRKTHPFVSGSADQEPEPFGMDNWRRFVYTPVGPQHDADRLIVGETHSPSGNWSSFPPHKHDVYDPPTEVPAEEFYHFQIDPPQGFGFQRVYTDPKDPDPISEVYVIQNGDTVAMPRGYHPVVVAPGYRMVTLWAFAIESRVFGAWRQDPQHSHLGSERGRLT